MIVDRHGRRHFPAGTPGSRGGEFAPGGEAGAGWVGAVAARMPPGDRTEAGYRAAVEFDDEHTGLRVRATLIRLKGRLRIDADIRNRDDQIVGNVRWYGEAGPDTIRLDELTLAGRSTQSEAAYKVDPEGYQGQGFGTRYIAHYRAQLKALGFKRIEMLADIDVGGYSWAVAGLDFRTTAARSGIKARARRMLVQFPQFRAEVEALAKRKDSAPIEWARIGWVQGASTWFGKRVMKGSDWAAVDNL